MGLTVVDPATVITTHLTELVRDNLADLLTYAETQKLLGDLPAEYQKLMGELVPARITTAGIQRVLQGLLGERVSIRDLPRILEAIAEALAVTQGTMLITEHVRARLARQSRRCARANPGWCRSSPCRPRGSRPSLPPLPAMGTNASWRWRQASCNASCGRCRSRSRR